MKEKAAGQEALENLEAEFDQLQNDVGQQKQDLDEAKKENAALSENLEKEKTNHEEYLKFKASSESDEKEQMKKLSDEIEKLSDDNKNLREETDQAKVELDIAAKAGSELAAKVKSLEEALSKSGALQKELDEIKSQLENKQTELDDANDRAAKAAESAAAATAAAAAAAADKKAKAGKTKTTAADKMKDEQIEELKEELADKEDELECAEEEVKRLREMLDAKNNDGVAEVVIATETEPEVPKVVVAELSGGTSGNATEETEDATATAEIQRLLSEQDGLRIREAERDRQVQDRLESQRTMLAAVRSRRLWDAEDTASASEKMKKMSAMKAKLLAKKAALEEKKAKLAAEKKRKAEAEAEASAGEGEDEGEGDDKPAMKTRLRSKKAKKGK